MQGLDIMQIGPQLPPLVSSDVNFDDNGYGPHTKAFLDEALETDGSHSVLYIRLVLGLVCYPSTKVMMTR